MHSVLVLEIYFMLEIREASDKKRGYIFRIQCTITFIFDRIMYHYMFLEKNSVTLYNIEEVDW